MRLVRALLALVLLLTALPAFAQTPEPSAALKRRAEQLVPILNGKREPAGYFAPSFLAQVPLTQVHALAKTLSDRNGQALKVQAIKADSPETATIEIGYQRAVVRVRLILEVPRPNRVTGLFVTGSIARDDTMDKVVADVAALSGTASFGVVELGAGAPRWIAAHRRDAQMAIGSSVKLYVLATLSKAAAEGTHRWADVTTLGPASLGSGVTQKWPAGSPMTLQSLATLMISVSDNSATDTLIDVIGRDAVGAVIRETGHADPARTLPILKTSELFALKMPANDALRLRWEKGNEADRTALLAENAERLKVANVNFARLSSAPSHIDTVEWFASPADMIAVLDRIRTDPQPQAREILAVNSGVDALTAARFPYIGFKGGSENGVIALNYLVRDRRNRWFVVTGAWNNTKQAVNEANFSGLMLRALALVAR